MNTKTVILAIGFALMIIAGALFIQAVGVGEEKLSDLPTRVACIGDSITESSGYSNELWRMLGANYTVRNFGVGGTTVSLDNDFPYMYQTAFQEAKKFQPHIVIIMLGTNDANPYVQQFNSSFVNDYIHLISAFEALASKPKIWLVKPPPIFDNGTGLSTPYFTSQVLPRIEEVATKTKLPLIDVYSALINHPERFGDGVHPDEEGGRLIAEAIFKGLSSTISH
jgi:lysophospholipase L1-like esterase